MKKSPVTERGCFNQLRAQDRSYITGRSLRLTDGGTAFKVKCNSCRWVYQGLHLEGNLARQKEHSSKQLPAPNLVYAVISYHRLPAALDACRLIKRTGIVWHLFTIEIVWSVFVGQGEVRHHHWRPCRTWVVQAGWFMIPDTDNNLYCTLHLVKTKSQSAYRCIKRLN